MLKRAFFDTKSRCLCIALLSHYTSDNDIGLLLKLLPLACEPVSRGMSEGHAFSAFPKASLNFSCQPSSTHYLNSARLWTNSD
jgi:hypothetical protein